MTSITFIQRTPVFAFHCVARLPPTLSSGTDVVVPCLSYDTVHTKQFALHYSCVTRLASAFRSPAQYFACAACLFVYSSVNFFKNEGFDKFIPRCHLPHLVDFVLSVDCFQQRFSPYQRKDLSDIAWARICTTYLLFFKHESVSILAISSSCLPVLYEKLQLVAALCSSKWRQQFLSSKL